MTTWPKFADDEIEAVERVLRSGRVNYWTGEEGRRFEEEYARYCGSRHAVAVANASVGLELALYALGIGPGDEVIVPPRTFIATASSVVLRGATPVFADVDRDSQNVSAASIEPVLSPRTRAIIAVHLAGWPCDMGPIMELARQRNLKVIEDCAQAHGARYRGSPVGALGDVGVFSFCQDKIITTGGEGGMLVTSDADVWQKAWSYKDHGKDYAASHAPRTKGDTRFRWLHRSFGTNWRLTELQSAIGRIQLRKLDGWVAQRRANAATLTKTLQQLKAIRVPQPGTDVFHAYYKYYAFLRPECLSEGWSRDRIIAVANERGARCFSGSCSEVYLEDAFAGTGFRPAERLPTARDLGETSLMLEVDPGVQPDSLQRTASILAEVIEEATSS